MQPYNKKLTTYARKLRGNLTDAEQLLWQRLRRKQIQNLQFYRQKIILDFIVDFYCAKAMLVIEVDGSQHFESAHKMKDDLRDARLEGLGIQVMRFDNLQVLKQIDAVVAMIDVVVCERLVLLNPP